MRYGWIAAAAIATLGGPIAAAPRRAAPPPPLNAAAYTAAVAPITGCSAFFDRARSLPQPTPLLRALFANGLPEQAAGESGEAFVSRVVERLFTQLGDPSRVVMRLAVGPDARYDAAAGMLTVPLADGFEALADAGPPPLRATLAFPAGAAPAPVSLPMTAVEAQRFRAGAGQMAVLALVQDYGLDDAPAAGGQLPRLLRLTPKCAFFLNAGTEVPGWRYDGWEAAIKVE